MVEIFIKSNIRKKYILWSILLFIFMLQDISFADTCASEKIFGEYDLSAIKKELVSLYEVRKSSENIFVVEKISNSENFEGRDKEQEYWRSQTISYPGLGGVFELKTSRGLFSSLLPKQRCVIWLEMHNHVQITTLKYKR